MRDDVREVLERQYQKTLDHQAKNGIRVELTLDQFIAKWSRYRIEKLGERIDQRRLDGYLRNPEMKPVCGWTTREARAGGVMNDGNCSIQVARDQRRLFQNKAGDKLRPDTIEKMRKPKSEAHREKMKKPKSEAHRQNMARAAAARWERDRAEKAERT